MVIIKGNRDVGNQRIRDKRNQRCRWSGKKGIMDKEDQEIRM